MKITRLAKKASRRRLAHEAEGGISGALAGATAGAIAGAPGAIAGAVIGGAVGALAGAVLDTAAVKRTEDDRRLDAEIGVSGGELGAPNLEHPPPRSGAYSAPSAGSIVTTEQTPAEGPFQAPDS